MRLIDADALKDNMSKWLKEADKYPSDIPPMEDIIVSTIMTIEEEPTVDAIPVEWIEETMQLAEKVGAKEYAEHLEVLLDDWAEERGEE